MYPFFVALHILLCLFLIVIIMLQPGKGGDPGLTFGGGGSNLFGPRGPAGVLTRATTVVAVLYMATTVTLALYSNRSMLTNANVDEELQRLQQDRPAPEAPAPAPAEAPAEAPVPTPEAPAPSPAPAP
jgi:preprotein translocase subunit SecG